MRKQSSIGDGNLIQVTAVPQEAVFDCVVMLPNNVQVPANDELPVEHCKPVKSNPILEKSTRRSMNAKKDEDEDESVLSEGTLFYCSKDPNCTMTFLRHHNMEKHALYGKCHIPKQLSSKQQIQRKFAKKFSVNPEEHVASGSRKVINLINLEAVEVPAILKVAEDDASDFVQGCALQSKRTNKRFSKALINYLNEVYLEGERTKRKATAAQVEKDLRRARDENGKLMFDVDEWLEEIQIKSYFSRLASKKTTKSLTLTNEELDEVLDDAKLQENINDQNAIMESLEEEEPKIDLTKHPMKVAKLYILAFNFWITIVQSILFHYR